MDAVTIAAAVSGVIGGIISVLTYMRVNPNSRWLRGIGLGVSMMALLAGIFFVGRAVGIRSQPSAHSGTASQSTLALVYPESSVQVAQESLNIVKHPGEELSSSFLLNDNIRFDWNGKSKIYLTADNDGLAPIWVDDILEVTIVNPDGQERNYYHDFSNKCTKGSNSGGAGVDLTKYFEQGENTIQTTIKDNPKCTGKNGTVGSSDIFLRGTFRSLP